MARISKKVLQTTSEMPPQQRAYQASGKAEPSSRQAKTLAITSGKGGVGKSNISTNLAITLAQQGARVCIFDADTSLANVNILMGLTPKYNIEHLLTGEKSLDEIMLKGPANVSVVPASSGLAALDKLDNKQQDRLINALEVLEKRFDYLIIDTAAGISNNVTRFLRSAHSILLVITTEPTSLTDAFALLRVLKRTGYNQTTHVLVNMAINYSNSMEVFNRFKGAVRKYLKLPLNFIGYITDDVAVKESVRHQCPVVLYRPDSLATRCFSNLEKVLINNLPSHARPDKFSTFWKILLTPAIDDIKAASIAKILNRNIENAEDIREGIINYISGHKLNNNDLLNIIFNISKRLTKTPGSNDILDDTTQELLEDTIKNLYLFTQKNIDSISTDDLHKTIMRITSSGTRLGQQLDKLNDELEEILK